MPRESFRLNPCLSREQKDASEIRMWVMPRSQASCRRLPQPRCPPETPREPPLLQTSLWEGGASSQVAASESSYPPPSLAASPAL